MLSAIWRRIYTHTQTQRHDIVNQLKKDIRFLSDQMEFSLIVNVINKMTKALFKRVSLLIYA